MSEGVRPRQTKHDFMCALGLQPGNTRDEKAYRLVRDEVANAHTHLNADRVNLLNKKQSDNSIQPPFFWHHIKHDRITWAVNKIWDDAPVGSLQRTIFDRGTTDGENGPNWVIRWLLYNVFRSRDIRNDRSLRKRDKSASSQPKKRIFDPVRNVHRPR